MKFLRILLAGLICLLIVAVSVYIYHHILFVPYYEHEHLNLPPEEEYSFSEYFNDVSFTFVYIGKENEPALEIDNIGYIGNRQNLIIPGYVEKDSVTYKVLSVLDDNSVDCDTLFIPATVEYFDYEKILNKCCANVNYIIVEPGNKYYKSVDGNLFCGDSLVFDVRAVYHNNNTY